MGSALRPWEEFRMRFTGEIMPPNKFQCQEQIRIYFLRYRKALNTGLQGNADLSPLAEASCVNAGAEVCV
jgi:hypothetical protein